MIPLLQFRAEIEHQGVVVKTLEGTDATRLYSRARQYSKLMDWSDATVKVTAIKTQSLDVSPPRPSNRQQPDARKAYSQLNNKA
jgi:hypothetical protein